MSTSGKPYHIGRYEVRRELGRGTMGVVYEAWDPMLGRTIALKTVRAVADSRPEREAWERRFLTEARAAARLSHPSIVVVHDVGRDAETDVLYMALEYLRGETLAEWIGSGRSLPWRDALRVIGRVADALHHAHGQGVVHRDIKPANVMMLPTGEPKILDFGIARLDTGSLTTPGDLCGTPLYMSPEQASGEPVDARSDVFSLGALAWAVLAGRSPFAGPTVPDILARVRHRSPPPVSEVAPEVPAAVDRILARTMARSPEDRYPTAGALAQDIADVLADRPPRHLEGWTPSSTGEQTVVSTSASAEAAPLEPGPASDARHGRGRRPLRRFTIRFALLLVLFAAASVYFHGRPEDRALWTALVHQGWRSLPLAEPTQTAATPESAALSMRATPPPWVSPASVDPSPASEESAALGPDAAPPLSEAAEPGAGEEASEVPGDLGTSSEPAARPAEAAAQATPPATLAAGTPSPAVTPALANAPSSPSPKEARSPSPAPGKKPLPSAFLSVGFEHHLKTGTLEVWVDGSRVAREPLDSRVRKKILLFEVRKGGVQQKLRVTPGRHDVMLRLRAGGGVKTARSSAQFRASATRRLEAKIARISGKISLEWK